MAEASMRTRRPGWLIARLLMMIAACLAAVQPAAAQTVLRDAETEALLRDLARPLIEAAQLDPRNVEIALIQDRRSTPLSPV